MLIPSFIGAHFYDRISEKTFERVVLGLLLASGIALIVGGVRALSGK